MALSIAFHEGVGIVTFFEIPFIEDYIDTGLSQISCKLNDPCLMVLARPAVGNKKLWITHLIASWPNVKVRGCALAQSQRSEAERT